MMIRTMQHIVGIAALFLANQTFAQITGPLWSTSGMDQLHTWNQVAVGGVSLNTTQYPVFVIDGLPRSNPFFVNYKTKFSYNSATGSMEPTTTATKACIPQGDSTPHASMVSSILGGTDNLGVRGVFASTPIYALDVTDDSCSPVGAYYEAAALKIVEILKARCSLSGDCRVGVVNVSQNHASPAMELAMRQAFKILLTISPGYSGAFVVQSAGNRNADACYYTADLRLADDGFMTVGAIDENGQRWAIGGGMKIYKSAGFSEKWDDRLLRVPSQQSDTASNYGSCVDIWAPGKAVLGLVDNKSPRFGTGTSFAAPHVAALIAKKIASSPASMFTNPGQVEQWVRQNAKSLSVYDTATKSRKTTLFANFSGTSTTITAAPTVEGYVLPEDDGNTPPVVAGFDFANYLPGNMIGGSIEQVIEFPVIPGTSRGVMFGSFGAKTCTMTKTRDGGTPIVTSFSPTSGYSDAMDQSQDATYQYKAKCEDDQGNSGSAQLNFAIRTPPPPSPPTTVQWSATGANVVLTNTTAFYSAYNVPANTSIKMSYVGTEVGPMGCSFSPAQYPSGWNSSPTYIPHASYLPASGYWIRTLPTGYYRFFLTCYDAQGYQYSRDLRLTVS